jgi:serine/threonine protein phosphatase PrpC
MDSTPLVEVTAFTHQGGIRPENEDSLTIAGWVSDVALSAPRRSRHRLEEPLLVAVADGMGGHAAGEVASRYAVKRLAAETFTDNAAAIAQVLGTINAELYQTMAADQSLLGMGTTVVGLLLTARRAVWFNVGDSRLYRIRDRELLQVSVDDVPPGPRTGMIMQALGGAPTFEPISPHVGVTDLSIPSRWLLCSDGLSDMLADEEIALAMAASDEDAVRALFTQAMAAGGLDNISIVVVSVTPAAA